MPQVRTAYGEAEAMKRAIEEPCPTCDGEGVYEVTVDQPATEATGGQHETVVTVLCETCHGTGFVQAEEQS